MRLKTVREIIDKPQNFLREFNAMGKAIGGDMVLEITPATQNMSEVIQNDTDPAYVRYVQVRLLTAAGEVHSWYNGTLDITYTDTAAGNGDTTGEATLAMVEGQLTIPVAFTGTWTKGTKQTETKEVTAGAGTASGTITLTLTASGYSGDPVTLEVVQNDTAVAVATKIVTALNADADVSALFTASNVAGTSATITLTKKTYAANDATLSLAFEDTDTTGVTMGTSTNGTAGVAPDTNSVVIANESILGYTVTGGSSVETTIA